MPIEWRVHTGRVNANRRCAVRTRARQCGIWVQLACLIRAVVGAILLLVSGDVEQNPGPVTRTCHECHLLNIDYLARRYHLHCLNNYCLYFPSRLEIYTCFSAHP